MAEDTSTDSTGRRRSASSRYVDVLAALSGYSSALLIIAAAVVICHAVVLRYVVGASTIWQTELAIYFLIYAAFVGASYGLKHGDHVRISLVIDRLGPRSRQLIEAATSLLGFILVTVVVVLSAELWWDAVETGKRSGTAWNPPMAIPYAIVPLGMFILALQFLVRTGESLRKFRSKDPVSPDDNGESPEGMQPA